MKDPRYLVMMRFWNGHGYDETGKEVVTKKNASDLVLWILKTLRPFQICITDMDPQDPIQNPAALSIKESWILMKSYSEGGPND